MALLAAGCATLPPPVDSAGWETRRVELQRAGDWRLSGRVAVAVGEDGVSGGLDWRQDGEHAEIRMRGPAGGTLLSATVDGSRFSMTDRDGRSWSGDGLLELSVGDAVARLPVPRFRYWLLGVPAPGEPYVETFGEDRRLLQLDQSGWRLHYLRYADGGDHALPARIEMNAPGIRVRVVIAEWRPAP